jgi:hypothetical protein
VVGNFRTVAAQFIKRQTSNNTHAGHCWCWWIDVCRHLPSPYLLAMAAEIRTSRLEQRQGWRRSYVPRPASCIWCGALIDLLTTKEAAGLAGAVRDSIYL